MYVAVNAGRMRPPFAEYAAPKRAIIRMYSFLTISLKTRSVRNPNCLSRMVSAARLTRNGTI